VSNAVVKFYPNLIIFLGFITKHIPSKLHQFLIISFSVFVRKDRHTDTRTGTQTNATTNNTASHSTAGT